MTRQSLAHIALVVRDYDEAIGFYVGTLGFTLVVDEYQPAQDQRLLDRGVRIEREPMEADYGTVAVFLDLYGNKWDLIEFRRAG